MRFRLQLQGMSGAVLLSLAAATASANAETSVPASQRIFAEAASASSRVVALAVKHLGISYEFGGSGPSGFDCSGFTRFIFSQTIGVQLPRRAEEQAAQSSLSDVRREQLIPGDLVFFNTLNRTFSHVGIFVGGGRFIHSPSPGRSVRYDELDDPYWAQRFTGARRI